MKAVLDTNILLVANQQHPDVSPECIATCAGLLRDLTGGGVVVLDSNYRIVKEYMRKTDIKPPKRPGDVFLKWILRNISNANRVHQIDLTETISDFFDEFPGEDLQKKFDPPDRKFAAVANAHPEAIPLFQAADCKWLDWREELVEAGVEVRFICVCDAIGFYRKKFPERDVPLPPER